MLAATLRENGRKVVRFDDLYKDPETPDVVWVREVCGRGYVVITKDQHLLERTNAMMAWHRTKGKIFYIASASAGEARVIAAILKALRKMETLVAAVPGPSYFRVLIGGDVEQIRPEALPEFPE